jgi:hypothetical protein
MATESTAPEASEPARKKKKPLLYRLYRQKPVEMRRYQPHQGLGADVRARLTPAQMATGSPKEGDMVLRGSDGVERLITAEDFAEHYEPRPIG